MRKRIDQGNKVKFIKFRNRLINLRNVTHIGTHKPGDREYVSCQMHTISEYEIRFFLNVPSGDSKEFESEYIRVGYGRNESEWRQDWDWLAGMSTSSPTEDRYIGSPVLNRNEDG